MSIDHTLHSLFRCVEGRRRRDGAGVRPLLRHEDRLLPRRLSYRAEPQRHATARFPCIPDAMRRHRSALHRVRVQGKQVRDNIHSMPTWSRFDEFFKNPRSARFTTSAAAVLAMLHARGDLDVRRGLRPRSSTTPTKKVTVLATISGGSAIPASFLSTIRAGSSVIT